LLVALLPHVYLCLIWFERKSISEHLLVTLPSHVYLCLIWCQRKSVLERLLVASIEPLMHSVVG
jgi:hypothetical protein